jgi:hypothetical protein
MAAGHPRTPRAAPVFIVSVVKKTLSASVMVRPGR